MVYPLNSNEPNRFFRKPSSISSILPWKTYNTLATYFYVALINVIDGDIATAASYRWNLLLLLYAVKDGSKNQGRPRLPAGKIVQRVLQHLEASYYTRMDRD